MRILFVCLAVVMLITSVPSMFSTAARHGVLRQGPDPISGNWDASFTLQIHQSMIGQYELTPGVTYTINVEENKLMGQRVGRDKEELLPADENTFFRQGAIRGEKVFVRDASGRVTQMLDRRENNDLVWKRIKMTHRSSVHPPAGHNAAFVGSIPENYDSYLGPVLFDPYAADLVGRLDLPGSASVLELACGTGIVTRRLRDRLGPTARLVATDLNEAMLSYAARKFGPDEAVEWKQADATDLPFDDQSFDAVVCQFGLMFFPDKEKAARETYRVLKPGGTFVFSVWDAIEHNDLPHIAHSIISKFFEDKPPDFYDVPFSFHDPETIRSLVSTAGFKDIRLSLLPLPAISPSARDAAKGLVHGNPVIAAIKERDESKVPEIEAAVAAAVAAQCGDTPVRGRMQALICSAVR